MDDSKPSRHKTRSYAVAAFLGLFVGAALLALAGHLLPRGLSRLARRRQHGPDDR